MKRRHLRTAAASICLVAGLAVTAMGQPCGEGWVQRASGGPGGGSGRPLAYDTLRSRLVMFAGNSTWEWDGQAWSLRATTGPSSRDRLGLAFDGAHIIMFGGGGSVSTPLSETWQWDGAQWTQLFPATVPRARFSPGMVYDPIRQTVVMFGGDGYSAPQHLSDTWEWSRATGNWTQQPISGPQSSLVFGAYDTSRSCVTVWVGGAEPLWRRNSTGTDPWQPVPIGFGPASAAGLVFDQIRNTVVVTEWQWFPSSISTWELGSAVWSLRSNSAPIVASRSMAFDPVRQRTVLVNELGQTWEWDGLSSGPAILSSPPEEWFDLGGSVTISVTASAPDCRISGGPASSHWPTGGTIPESTLPT